MNGNAADGREAILAARSDEIEMTEEQKLRVDKSLRDRAEIHGTNPSAAHETAALSRECA
jgi:hypothetical protein